MAGRVEIENLRAFQRDLRAAADASPRELTAALKKAGDPVVKRAAQLSPRLTGALAGSYKAQVRGTTGSIQSGVPYGAGAEWGTKGKWSGFTKYGPPGSRFAGLAVDDAAEEIAEIIAKELQDIVELHGWAR